MYLYVWGKSKNNGGRPDQPAAHSQLLPNEVQGGKTEAPAKCVTLGASSKGTWFPTDLCFKAGVRRGVKFLLWKALSPVNSQVATRVALPQQPFSQLGCYNRLVGFHETCGNIINTLGVPNSSSWPIASQFERYWEMWLWTNTCIPHGVVWWEPYFLENPATK